MRDDEFDKENRMHYIVLTLILMVLFGVLANDGRAADYYLHKDQPNTLILDGSIEGNECARLESVLARKDYKTTHLIIRSTGGNSLQSHCMARTIRRLGLHTSTDFALSAGAIVWLGGVERELGFTGIVAVHGTTVHLPNGPRHLNDLEKRLNVTLIERLLLELGYQSDVRDLIKTAMVGDPDSWVSLHELATTRKGEHNVLGGN